MKRYRGPPAASQQGLRRRTGPSTVAFRVCQVRLAPFLLSTCGRVDGFVNSICFSFNLQCGTPQVAPSMMSCELSESSPIPAERQSEKNGRFVKDGKMKSLSFCPHDSGSARTRKSIHC